MTLWHRIANRRLDGRWFLGGSHLALLAVSMVFFRLQRDPPQVLVGFAAALLTEGILYSVTRKYPRGRISDRCFSAATEAAGLLILLRSHELWFYGLVSVLAVGSKYVFRRDDGRHIFNPTNFAIVFALAVFPPHWFAAWSDEYMRHWYPMLHVTAFGMMAVWLADSWRITMAYVVGLIAALLVAFPFSSLSDVVYAVGPELGVASLIFMFLMATDPKTSPREPRSQIVYGLAIAVGHVWLRAHEVLYSRYISLFVITLIWYLLFVARDWRATPAHDATTRAS